MAQKAGLDEKQAESNLLGLDESEIALLDRQVKAGASDAGYLAIYRYADKIDVLVIAASTILAVAAGSTMPLMTAVFGALTGKFTNFTATPTQLDEFLQDVHWLVMYFVYIGIASLLAITLHILGFTWTAERISKRIRVAYLDAVLRQEMGFFETLGAGEVAVRITADMNLIEDGISQKVGLTISGLGGLIAAEVIAFVISWRLALVMLCLPFVVTGWMIALGGRMRKADAGSIDAYITSSTLVEEALSSMRSVIAHGTPRRLATKYDRSLAAATKLDFTAKALVGALIGGMVWFMLMAFALCSWAGSRFKDSGDATVSQIVTVLFASIIAGVSFGSVAPNLQAFGAAGAAANRIFGVLERKSATPLGSGSRPDAVDGNIIFDAVRLVYPSRRSHLVLDDFSLEIPAGKTTAIVGASGSGKSSLFSLLQRLYPTLRGSISLDGYDIRDLDLRWLRSQVRIVSQESFLFNTTVFENIGYGLVGTEQESADNATKAKLIEEAARTANAHAFVSELPNGYQTRVGEGGSLLSGGQRQRIAIARAIVSNPRVLLLDEATASLDTRSENAIQNALEAASAGRTVVMIAHRLSTIRQAHKIVVLEHRRIVEQGAHQDLISKGGIYASFVASQDLKGGVKRDGDEGHAIQQTDDTTRRSAFSQQNADATQLVQKPTLSSEPSAKTRFGLVRFIWQLNKREQTYLFAGFLGSLFSGLAYPVTAILYGNLVLALDDPSTTLGGNTVNFWASMQLLLACVVFAGYLLQNIPLAYASSRLVSRARSVAFAAMLRQDMAFFDSHSAGSLTAFLSVQARKLNGLGGAILGTILNSVVAVAAGFAVAVGFGWKLGLVAASTMPLTVVTGYARYRVLADLEKGGMRGGDAAGIVAEAVRGIRTVTTLGVGHIVRQRYNNRLDDEVRSGLLRDLALSFLYAFSQSVTFFVSALLFWYGGTHLITSGEYTVRDFLICFVATTYSAQSAGGIFSFAPDIAGAQEAADRLQRLVETVPAIDAEAVEGETADGMVGNVELSQVDFSYSTPDSRGDHRLVLDKASFNAPAGSFVALVGASGSGKTTALGMLERFYDPVSGHVLADNLDIRRYRLQQYRSELALVDQDAVLYSGTIRDNIITDSDADQSAVEQACREANIWEFVESMPDGLDTRVGPRGGQVSGGQKQRLAIARALLRRPKILLLDEATSSLDSSSEAAVQQALHAAAAGRTTIAIAHRLSSVHHADCIYVFENGKVIEQGAHGDLMAKKGRYWEYVGMQDLAS